MYEWAGRMPAFERLTEVFYMKVASDELLGNVFRHMKPEHQIHVARFIAEVFGGPPSYTENGGSHASMIQQHLGRHLTEAQRRRWVNLLLDAADEINLPDDPEFRSAFVAYIEWGTRLAVVNSQLSELNISEAEPMPKWGWGVPKGPYLNVK